MWRPLPCLLAFLVAPYLDGCPFASGAPLARTAVLNWQRGPGADACIDGPGLERAVEARLGRPVFIEASQAEALVSGVIEHVPSPPGAPTTFAVRLAIADRAGNPLGTRDLVLGGDGCASLTAAIALVLAVTLDPDQPLRPEPVIVKAPPPPPPALPLPLRSDRQLGLAVGSSLGSVPGPFVDLLARVHVARPHVPVFAVSVGMDLPRTTATTGGATVSFSRVSLAFAWVPLDNRKGPNRLRGLLGLEASAVVFAGHGFDQSAGGRRFVAAGTAGLDFHHALGAHAFFFTALDFAAPLRRERYYFTESDGVSRRQVFTTAPVTARIVAGGGLGF